jgi:type I restriction enzyme S subunit
MVSTRESKQMEKIGSIAEFKRGPFGSAVKKGVCVPKSSGTFKLYEQGNVINNDFERGKYYLTKERFEMLSQFEIKPRDLLLTCAGTLGRIAVVPENIEKGIFNSVLMRIRPNYHKVIRDYMYYYFQSPKIQNDINKQSAGVAIKNLFATKRLKEYTIYLPDKKEQQQIVDEIEKQLTRLDAAVETFKGLKQKLDVYRKSILKNAFQGIETKQLQTFCDDVKADIVDGPFGSNMKRSDYTTEGIPVLKIQNVKPFKIIVKKMDYVSKKKYEELQRHSYKTGDIIITKLGDPLGVSAIVPAELKKGIIVADLVRVRATKINTDYLVYVLNSPIISNYINSKQKGTTRPRVKLSIVRELPIPYVKPTAQKQIVQEIESRFSVIDKLEETINNSLAKAEQLRKSILKAAFEGKLVKEVQNAR